MLLTYRYATLLLLTTLCYAINVTAISLAPTNSSILDAHQEVRDVVMVRQAEVAAMDAKSHAANNNKRKSEEDAAPGKSSDTKECNDVCVIC